MIGTVLHARASNKFEGYCYIVISKSEIFGLFILAFLLDIIRYKLFGELRSFHYENFFIVFRIMVTIFEESW